MCVTATSLFNLMLPGSLKMTESAACPLLLPVSFVEGNLRRNPSPGLLLMSCQRGRWAKVNGDWARTAFLLLDLQLPLTPIHLHL